MKSAMVATNWEEYDQAIDILKELIKIKGAQNKVSTTVTKLEGLKSSKQKG